MPQRKRPRPSERSPSRHFGNQLREARNRRGLSQEDVARLVRESVGLDHFDTQTITRIETGKRALLLDEALAIGAALGVSPLYLMLPLEDETLVELGPESVHDARTLRGWLRGIRVLLPEDLDRWDEEDVPPGDELGSGGFLRIMHIFYEGLRKEGEETHKPVPFAWTIAAIRSSLEAEALKQRSEQARLLQAELKRKAEETQHKLGDAPQ